VNKKSRFKSALVFSIAMMIFSIFQSLLFRDNHTTNEIIKSVVVGILSGAISGVLFWWLIGLFANSKIVKESTKIETHPDENIIFETPANHFKGMEGVGGKLYLTNKRLVFKSHKYNIQNHELSISLSDLTKVYKRKTLGLISNGFSIITRDAKTEKFVVEDLDKWIEYLSDKTFNNIEA
jgi:hypothetical protein